jgi:hypothetical protein
MDYFERPKEGLLISYNWDDQNKENDMGGACSMHEEE